MNIIIGFLSGLTASMGLGGGFVLMLYLTIFTDTPQIQAQGINLLFFLPIAVVALILNGKKQLVSWRILPLFCLTGLVGASIGFLVSMWISTDILSKLFAVLVGIVGIKEFFHKSIDK
jgi:uncharacterized membrane protein YfcA